MDLRVALAIFEYVVLLLSLSLHDALQAYTALRLGDPTPHMLGRVSLNPVRHYDIWGTIVFPIFYLLRAPIVLGWTKPLPLTTRNFKTYRAEMLVSLSGPVTHLFAALLCTVVLLLLKHALPGIAGIIPLAQALTLGYTGVPTDGLPQIFPIVLFLYFGILVNSVLFAYNLLPLPWLDGGRVFRHYLPYNARQQYDNLGMYLMFAFFFLGFPIIMMITNPLLGFFGALLERL